MRVRYKKMRKNCGKFRGARASEGKKALTRALAQSMGNSRSGFFLSRRKPPRACVCGSIYVYIRVSKGNLSPLFSFLSFFLPALASRDFNLFDLIRNVAGASNDRTSRLITCIGALREGWRRERVRESGVEKEGRSKRAGIPPQPFNQRGCFHLPGDSHCGQ